MGEVLLVQSEARAIPLVDESVHSIVTSPPYWGLRDYGIGVDQGEVGSEPLHDCLGWARQEAPCGECYVCHMREVMAECWRVLREDGTLWLNLGDTYNSTPSWGRGHSTLQGRPQDQIPQKPTGRWLQHARVSMLKPKSLVGIPWRLALALQADGWVLRQDLIWHAPNKIPESVRDRCTKAHEYVFLCAKRPRYFFDSHAIAEPATIGSNGSSFVSIYDKATKPGVGQGPRTDSATRSARSVWRISTEPTSFAHFATMPQALVERCIKAGTSAYGCCAACGAPWARVVETTYSGNRTTNGLRSLARRHESPGFAVVRREKHTTTMCWNPSCSCITDALADGCRDPQQMDWLTTPRPCTVLDPFVGSGTVPLVARELGRHSVGLDLSWPYLHDVARKRLGLEALAAWEGRASSPPEEAWDTLPLFRARR